MSTMAGILLLGETLRKSGCELLAFDDVDGVDSIRQPDLLEHDRHLLPVRRHPRVELDHDPPHPLAAPRRMPVKRRCCQSPRRVQFAVAENLIHQVFIPRPPYRQEPVAPAPQDAASPFHRSAANRCERLGRIRCSIVPVSTSNVRASFRPDRAMRAMRSTTRRNPAPRLPPSDVRGSAAPMTASPCRLFPTRDWPAPASPSSPSSPAAIAACMRCSARRSRRATASGSMPSRPSSSTLPDAANRSRPVP